jgi:hypothetical protein
MTARELATHAASKATSARWLCTVGALLMWYVMRAEIDAGTHTTLIATVILSYFQRRDRDNSAG